MAWQTITAANGDGREWRGETPDTVCVFPFSTAELWLWALAFSFPENGRDCNAVGHVASRVMNDMTGEPRSAPAGPAV